MKKNKTLSVSILFSLILLLITWLSFDIFYHWLNDFLMAIFKPFATWNLNQIVFTLTIGLIPISSYISWNSRKNKRSSLISFNIISFCMLILLCLLVFFTVDIMSVSESPLVPEYIIYLPFSGFWNYSLPLSSLVTPIATYFINKKNLNT